MPHPDEGLIHAWLDGELDAAEAARVEALVASDPEWTAAAAEARGLIAASARIVGSLDRVPANVIPKAAPAPSRAPPRTTRWMLRAAAVLVLIGGTAVVVNRSSVDGVTITIPVKEPQPQVNAPAAAPPAAKPVEQKKKLAETKSTIPVQELDAEKKNETLRDKKSVASETGELRAKDAVAAAGGAASNSIAPSRRADAAPAAPSPVAGAAPAAKARSLMLEQTVVSGLRCFLQRAPADSASRIIRLDAAALNDSIRLEKLALHGDTLAAVNGKLIAVLVRCPAP